MMKFPLVHWLLLLFLGTLAIGCLVLAIRQFIAVNPIDRRNQLRRSLIIAGLLAILNFIVVLIAGVFIWAETGIFESIILVFPGLYLIPFVFAISVVGTYIQFFWYERLSKYRDDLIQKQVERFESHDQEPPSK